MPISKPIPTTQSPKSIARLVNTLVPNTSTKHALSLVTHIIVPGAHEPKRNVETQQISQEEEGDLGDSQGRKFLRQPPILIHGREEN